MGPKTKRAKLGDEESEGRCDVLGSYVWVGQIWAIKRKVHLLGFCLDSGGEMLG